MKKTPTKPSPRGKAKAKGGLSSRLRGKAMIVGSGLAQGSFNLSAFCKRYAVTPEAVSRLTGAAPRTVAYWKAGKEPQRSSQQKFREMTRLFDALADLVEPKGIGLWLNRPNKAFEGSTPLQVIERGETDRLWRMIWELREGNVG